MTAAGIDYECLNHIPSSMSQFLLSVVDCLRSLSLHHWNHSVQDFINVGGFLAWSKFQRLEELQCIACGFDENALRELGQSQAAKNSMKTIIVTLSRTRGNKVGTKRKQPSPSIYDATLISYSLYQHPNSFGSFCVFVFFFLYYVVVVAG